MKTSCTCLKQVKISWSANAAKWLKIIQGGCYLQLLKQYSWSTKLDAKHLQMHAFSSRKYIPLTFLFVFGAVVHAGKKHHSAFETLSFEHKFYHFNIFRYAWLQFFHFIYTLTFRMEVLANCYLQHEFN